MSGLTLGLLSLDTVELEVLLRSGTPREQKYARRIMPLIANTHSLLVTLLLCNALAMVALPLFLDKLADPVTAVIVSVTAVLLGGEIIPQAICSRYGLAIGARLAPLVRALMWLCSPVSWPVGKLLDVVLGHNQTTLFRRRQLREFVSIHAEDAGMGGALTRDEIKVITGALDLTSKVAYRAMTPLDKVRVERDGGLVVGGEPGAGPAYWRPTAAAAILGGAPAGAALCCLVPGGWCLMAGA
ncbi:hypothetical protein GPECTOR_1g562 [Gonium pectorale]|uniref:CNNM transmembrane domain-containing protein n=1 Tax=Gonium pectorale TaxID=33097 RepID=A0A150H3J3_GONPE|nr:hypothetical protein GPECTOR_1g562 [Gonium pectorale]|eukprot:KXZ56624.1 hypothetical protein GPECTOR_1g562 [Gonium pectorale]